MDKERNSIFYDHLRKHAWKYAADFGPSARSRYRKILQLLTKFSNKNASIIDVGCGSGNLLKLLLQNGYRHVSGSDFSCESVKTSKQKVGDIVFQADLTIEKCFKYKYDVVICSDVLEHIQNDEQACKELFNLLNDKGIAIISVPVNQDYWSAHDEFSGHVRRYEPKQLESILINQGFSVCHSHYWGSGVYSLYHFILRKTNPSNVMSSKKTSLLKKFIFKITYYIFILEDYYSYPSTAKRLFLVAKKFKD